MGSAAPRVRACLRQWPTAEFTVRPTPFGSLGSHYLVLPGAVILLGLPWLLEIGNVLWTGLVAAQLVLCAIGVVSSYSSGLRPLRLVFFLFTLSWLGVGPLYQLAHRQLAWSDSVLLERTNAVTAALALTLLATLVASVVMWHTSSHHQEQAQAPQGTGIVPRRWAPWGFLAVMVVLAPYVIATNGGLASLFASRGDRTANLSAAGVTIQQSGGAQVGLVVILPVALAVASTHLFILRIRMSRREGAVLGVSLLDALGLAGGLLGMVLFANPISNTRFISLAAFGSVAMAVLRPRRAVAGGWLAAALALVTLGVYPLSDLLTSGGTGQSALAVFASKDFDGFQQIINTLSYVHAHGYSLGRYSISALLFFVPRSMWSWKATPSAIDVAESRGYWFTNLSMPVHSEMYLEFGLIGMVLFAGLLGYAWARIDAAWLFRPGSRAAWIAPYVCMAEMGFIRGPLGSLTPVWLPVIALLLLGVRRVQPPGTGPAGIEFGGEFSSPSADDERSAVLTAVGGHP